MTFPAQSALFETTQWEVEPPPARPVGRPRVSTIPVKYVDAKKRNINYYREQDRARTRRMYERRKPWYTLIKERLTCQVCGHHSGAAVDFHHIDPRTKKFTPSLGNIVRNRAKFLAELAKCAPVCAACHRQIHHGGLSAELTPIDPSTLPPMPD